MPVMTKLLLMRVLDSAMFVVPVAVAYYRLRGVDFGQYLLLLAILKSSVIVLEIPTGYLADRWHRRHVIAGAQLLFALGTGVLLIADGFLLLLTVQVLYAASNALSSGTESAYLFDYLEQQETTDQAERFSGRLSGAAFLSEASCGLVGAWLYTLSPSAPVAAMLVAAILAFMIALSLPDVPRRRRLPTRNPLADLSGLVVRTLVHRPDLRWVLPLPTLIIGCTGILFWSIQVRLQDVGVGTQMIGAAVSAYFLLKGGIAFAAGPITERLGSGQVAALLIVLLAAGGVALSLATNPWLVFVGAFACAGITHALGEPVFAALINRRTTPDERATVQSVANLMQTLWGAAIMSASHWLLNWASTADLLLGVALLSATLACVPLMLLRDR